MTPSNVAQMRHIALLQHVASRLGWQHGAERRAIKTLGRAESRPRRIEQRAALLHVARDILEIGRRQHVHLLVAIEDDQIELIELLVEELADREGDERELADRRAGLLLRRPQNGEM